MSNILASAIANNLHFSAFDIMAKKKIDSMALEKLLLYIIDTVDAQAIPYLAAQFDVLGYKGMRLAKTEEQQREVIKKAIELKRYKGTVWAVKEAMRAIGYPSAQVLEHVGVGPNGWAVFSIVLDGGQNQISADTIEDVLKMIAEYKNERSHLKEVSFFIDLGGDGIMLTDESDELASILESDEIKVSGNFKYNGEFMYDGSKNYSSDSDILEINIVT